MNRAICFDLVAAFPIYNKAFMVQFAWFQYCELVYFLRLQSLVLATLRFSAR